MEFLILGPLEVRDAGRVLNVPGSKAKALLAILLLRGNQVVATDELIDEIWGEDAPETAASALYVHVSELRKALSAGPTGTGAGGRIVTRRPGYLLRLEGGELDLERFERLATEGRHALREGEPGLASARLHEALALWRGAPLADLVGESFAHVEAARLEELRISAFEPLIEADLALGRHAEVVPDLEKLVAQHPLREGFRAQLMIALYRSGRQAEALEAYREARSVLAERLGLEPGPVLQQLERAILVHDCSLAPPESAMATTLPHPQRL